nr:PIG-L family deacetylase [Micromonospora echinofusca]
MDVLFVSAHPDDEAGSLATLGQWNEKHGAKAGVVTITRGEGGGNAVGLEEGPPLGIIREREERTAIGRAGVENLYNLDRVDFWYTASAPLSEQIWGHDDTLGQIVRVIRQTRPEIVMTMNPSPTPGNHGNHQQAARFAAEAFHAAADPKAFPEQITKEGLTPFRAAKFLRTGGTGSSSTGPQCAAGFVAAVPTDQVFGVWEGARSAGGKTWAEVEVDARRDYVTQGWANTAAAPTDPAKIRWAPGNRALTSPRVSLRLPQGWTATGSVAVRGAVPAGKERTVTFTVTVPAGADTNAQHLVGASLTTGQGTGRTDRAVRVVADVRGTLEPLPEVGLFRSWAGDSGYPQLDTLIKPVPTIGSGKSRTVRIDLRNHGETAQSGTVALGLPAGFTADAATKSYAALAPGATGAVTFTVTNSDASLPTANEGGDGGDGGITITTTSAAGSTVETGALEIVPTSEVPRAGHDHAVDGVASPGEYPGEELDLSRIWEGQATTAQDASATGRIAFTEDALVVFVQVTDDVLGKKVVPQDCKRQRRTDSVEIIVDPKGNSSDTSTVFKAGIFPVTDDPANGDPPCWQRDADNRQGPGATTAPGMTVVSKVTAPYTGYTVEARIPFAVLPDAIDPARMGFNVLVYDSDTQDLSSQSRLGWSTFHRRTGRPVPLRAGHPARPHPGAAPAQRPGLPGHRRPQRAQPADHRAVGGGRRGAGRRDPAARAGAAADRPAAGGRRCTGDRTGRPRRHGVPAHRRRRPVAR